MTPEGNTCASAGQPVEESESSLENNTKSSRKSPTPPVSTGPVDGTPSMEAQTSALSRSNSLAGDLKFASARISKVGTLVADIGISYPEAADTLSLAVANLTFTKLLIEHELRRISPRA